MRRMRTRLLAFAVVCSSLVAADAFAQQPPQPQGPPLSGPPTAGEPPRPPGVALPAAPVVDDPMLAAITRPKVEIATWEEALNHVRARSTDIRIAAQEVARAEGLQRVALAAALPTINATGTYTHNIITKDSVQFNRAGTNFVPTPVQVPFPDFATGQISLVQPVFALRSWYAIKTAGISTDAAKLSYEDAKRQIALNVANAIVGVVTAERIAELNRAGLRNALQRFDLTVRRSALGAATGLDVVRSRQDVESARATLVAGDETLRQSRESLGLALGIPEQVGVPPNVDISGLERDARATCKPAESVDARSDIAALRTRVTVAHRTVNDVKYQFVPTVNLQSGVGTTTVDTGAAPNTTWNVQAVLNIPLWEGGARYGNLRETEAREIIAEQNLEVGRRKATIEVTQARRAVQVADDRRRVATSARDLALELDRLTRTAFQEGRGTSLELVTAAQALRVSEIELALREFELVKARVAAVLALATCPW